MSLTWMALVASVVALQKLSRRPHVARAVTAGVLMALVAGMLIAPDAVPGFVVPGAHDTMHAMPAMESRTDLHPSKTGETPAVVRPPRESRRERARDGRAMARGELAQPSAFGRSGRRNVRS
jgi:hypothetical protein